MSQPDPTTALIDALRAYIAVEVARLLPSAVPTHMGIKDAARRVGISPSLMRNLCLRGDIEASRTEGRWMVSVASLDAFMVARRHDPARPVMPVPVADEDPIPFLLDDRPSGRRRGRPRGLAS